MTDPLRKAAEGLIKEWDWECGEHQNKALTELIETLRQALAQPEQEPVECMCGICKLGKREWQGLTDEEIDGIYKTHHDQYGKCQTGGFEYERTIEAKLKEKNNG